MVLDEERSIADVATVVGVDPGTLGNWVGKEREVRDETDGLGVDERASSAICERTMRSFGGNEICSNDLWPSG